jgi:hypothetical protein
VAGIPAVMIRNHAERASQQRVLSLISTGFPFHCRDYPAAPEWDKGNKEDRQTGIKIINK